MPASASSAASVQKGAPKRAGAGPVTSSTGAGLKQPPVLNSVPPPHPAQHAGEEGTNA